MKITSVDGLQEYLARYEASSNEAARACGDLFREVADITDPFKALRHLEAAAEGHKSGPWQHHTKKGIAAAMAQQMGGDLQDVIRCPHCRELFESDRRDR